MSTMTRSSSSQRRGRRGIVPGQEPRDESGGGGVTIAPRAAADSVVIVIGMVAVGIIPFARPVALTFPTPCFAQARRRSFTL